MEMEPWEAWVRGTELSIFARTHPWVWPLTEITHYVGLSLLLGTVGLFDLRVLGLARAIAPSALHRLIPWGVAGYAVNLCTGLVFFSAFPDQYAYNSAFRFKLAFMALAGVNLLIFYSAIFRDVRTLGAGDEAPLRAKVVTAISLFAWMGVLTCGRLLTFYRPPFQH